MAIWNSYSKTKDVSTVLELLLAYSGEESDVHDTLPAICATCFSKSTLQYSMCIHRLHFASYILESSMFFGGQQPRTMYSRAAGLLKMEDLSLVGQVDLERPAKALALSRNFLALAATRRRDGPNGVHLFWKGEEDYEEPLFLESHYNPVTAVAFSDPSHGEELILASCSQDCVIFWPLGELEAARGSGSYDFETPCGRVLGVHSHTPSILLLL